MDLEFNVGLHLASGGVMVRGIVCGRLSLLELPRLSHPHGGMGNRVDDARRGRASAGCDDAASQRWPRGDRRGCSMTHCITRTVADGRTHGRRRILPGVLSLMLCMVVVSTSAGGGAEDRTDVDADAVVRGLPRTVWFDPQEEGYRPPRLRPLRDDPLRVEGWTARQNRTSPTKIANSRGRGGLGSNYSDIVSAVVVTLVGILLLIIIGLLSYFAFRNYAPGIARRQARSIVIDTARVDDLPFEANRAEYTNPLALAEHWMQQGAYRQAVILVYGYILLVLDQTRKIDLQKGKTNRMYLRELGPTSPLYPITELAMLVFEDAFFGNHPISEERFRSVWNALPEFHRLLTEDEPSLARPASTVEASGS
ncbi:MAG: DUF4129 domain-containing protein [Planctomycetota bacterium]|nr:MAG: DUF4129 domain-containing protein [Planctomycetota bacterium]